MSFAGISGRFPVMLVQFAPPSTVLNTWPDFPGVALLYPDTAKYAANAFVGSTAMPGTKRPGKPALRSVHVAVPPDNAFLPMNTLPPCVDAYTVFESPGATAMVLRGRPGSSDGETADHVVAPSLVTTTASVPKYNRAELEGSITRGAINAVGPGGIPLETRFQLFPPSVDFW